MSGENKTLTPVWIAYVDGMRLGTGYEGALKRIYIHDRLDFAGTASLLFGSSPADFCNDGTFTIGSEVSIHLGYKDDVQEVFAGEVTGFAPRLNEYSSPLMEVKIHSKLHRLDKGTRCASFEHKTPAGIIRDIVQGYNLNADVEEFGPEYNYIEQKNFTDYGYIMYLAGKYGKTVYCHGNTVYVKTEIAPTDDDVVLEWGKSIISARAKTSMTKQLSAATCTGWSIMDCRGFAATATMKDIPLKIGGGYSWEDNSKGYDPKKIEQITTEEIIDEEDAAAVAKAYIQNRSFKFQSCDIKTQGNYHIKPGNRLMVKYIGKQSDGEYLIESVEHTLDMQEGFITKCHLIRNFCGVTLRKNVSEIDAEIVSSFYNETNNKTYEEKIIESPEQTETDVVSLRTKDNNPRIIKVELLDDNNIGIFGSEISNYVNLPDKDIFIDNDKIKGHYQLNGRIKCKITFDRKGAFDFYVSLKNIDLKTDYSSSELSRNNKYKFSNENEYKHYKTDSDGTKIISAKDFYLGQGGGNLFKFKAWTTDENSCILSTSSIRTWRRLYYVEVKMASLTTMASSLSTAICEYAKHYIDLKKIGTESVSFRKNIDVSDSSSFITDVLSQCNKAQYKNYSPYVVNVTYTGHLAVKERKQFKTIIPLSSTSYIDYELRCLSGNGRKYLWMNIDTQNWFNSCTLKINGNDYYIPENKLTPLATSPNLYSKVRVDISHLSISLPAIAELTLDINTVDRMRAGLSFGGSHTVALCTKAYWKNIADANQNQVLIHELGHQVGMVPNGFSKSKLNKGAYHYAHTHVGDHCYNGCSSAENLKSSLALRKSECVMFGATNNKPNFCTDCGRNVKKTDLSEGVY